MQPSMRDLMELLEKTGITKCESTDCTNCPFDIYPSEKECCGNVNSCVLLNQIYYGYIESNNISHGVKIINGNIFDNIQNGDFLLHQVNCQGVMGSGIAKQIKEYFPDVFNKYFGLCRTTYISSRILGTAQILPQQYNGVCVNVCNLFGQDGYGYNNQYTNYDALFNAMKQVREISCINSRILIPYNIGCYRGGGDWKIVYQAIKNIFSDREVVIYRLDNK